MSEIKITPVKYGESFLPESMVFQNGSKDKSIPIVFLVYLIKKEGRLILVDAGCVTMPGFEMSNFIGPVKALEKLGINPEDITDVIITHAHHDHIECAGCFKNAVIHIQRDEYEAGKGYLSENTDIRLFDDKAKICQGVIVIKIGGHSKGSCVVEITDGEDKYIVTGDECYSRKCLERKIPTGSSYCLENSIKFIEKYADSEYKALLCHEE